MDTSIDEMGAIKEDNVLDKMQIEIPDLPPPRLGPSSGPGQIGSTGDIRPGFNHLSRSPAANGMTPCRRSPLVASIPVLSFGYLGGDGTSSSASLATESTLSLAPAMRPNASPGRGNVQKAVCFPDPPMHASARRYHAGHHMPWTPRAPLFDSNVAADVLLQPEILQAACHLTGHKPPGSSRCKFGGA
jgi:hypothetical protein